MTTNPVESPRTASSSTFLVDSVVVFDVAVEAFIVIVFVTDVDITIYISRNDSIFKNLFFLNNFVSNF